jgi:hypothetical protein
MHTADQRRLPPDRGPWALNQIGLGAGICGDVTAVECLVSIVSSLVPVRDSADTLNRAWRRDV